MNSMQRDQHEENRMQGFVADLLRSQDALVEPIEPEGLDVLAPASVQRALGVGELSRLGFGSTLPPGAQRAQFHGSSAAGHSVLDQGIMDIADCGLGAGTVLADGWAAYRHPTPRRSYILNAMGLASSPSAKRSVTRSPPPAFPTRRSRLGA
jgi:hypothetical protein